MKKLYFLMMMAATLFAVGCGGSDDSDDDNGGGSSTNTTDPAITGDAKEIGVTYAIVSGSVNIPEFYKLAQESTPETGFYVGVYYGESESGMYNQQWGRLNGNNVTVTINNLEPSKKYYYKVYLKWGLEPVTEYIGEGKVKSFTTKDLNLFEDAISYSTTVGFFGGSIEASINRSRFSENESFGAVLVLSGEKSVLASSTILDDMKRSTYDSSSNSPTDYINSRIAWSYYNGETGMASESAYVGPGNKLYYTTVFEMDNKPHIATIQELTVKEFPSYDGFIDLGLSCLWAGCNVGMSSPWSMGQTRTKSSHTEYIRNFYNDNTVDLPTEEEVRELLSCEWTSPSYNAILITGKNGNQLYLPLCPIDISVVSYRNYSQRKGYFYATKDMKKYRIYGSKLELGSANTSDECYARAVKRSGQSTPNITPTTQQTTTYTFNGVSFKMVRVEGGTFQMGSENEDYEKPVHTVTLNSFSIGETEVTQELWYAITQQRPVYESSGSQWNSDWGMGNKYPAYYVSWDDCQEFIRLLNSATGKKFRMPTEAEWEYAARGGKMSKGYKFAGSDNCGTVAWTMFDENWNYIHGVHEVATKQPNELGLYDMSGNLYEWCYDWSGSYPTYPVTNPTGPADGIYRILRGGSCTNIYNIPTVTHRRSIYPSERENNYGLRLAMD